MSTSTLVQKGDALAADPGQRFDVVVAMVAIHRRRRGGGWGAVTGMKKAAHRAAFADG